MNPPDTLLSVTELASYLDVPIGTLYQWRYQGRGPAGFRVGRHLRYRWRDIEDWINRQLAAKDDS